MLFLGVKDLDKDYHLMKLQLQKTLNGQKGEIIVKNIIKQVDKQEALRILEEIEENINVCCAITMEPDEVLVLVDKLKSYIENGEQT